MLARFYVHGMSSSPPELAILMPGASRPLRRRHPVSGHHVGGRPGTAAGLQRPPIEGPAVLVGGQQLSNDRLAVALPNDQRLLPASVNPAVAPQPERRQHAPQVASLLGEPVLVAPAGAAL